LNDEDGDNGLDTMIMLNMFSQQSGAANNNLLPLLLMKGGDFDAKTLMLMQMAQGQGAQNNNLLPLLLMNDGGCDKDTFLMMAMMGGNNPFANLFGTTPATPVVANPATVAPVSEVVTDEHAADVAERVDDAQPEVVTEA
jgi:hypothetical protein